MKKGLIILVITIMFVLTGCGNQDYFDGFSSKSNTFNYILIKEGDEYYIHKLSKWIDSSTDAVGAVTSCCNNRIWTSYNSSILYNKIPKYLPNNIHICKGE